MLGGLTDQITKLFHELMQELRGIREELALVREALESQHGHPTLRPVPKRPASGRARKVGPDR